MRFDFIVPVSSALLLMSCMNVQPPQQNLESVLKNTTKIAIKYTRYDAEHDAKEETARQAEIRADKPFFEGIRKLGLFLGTNGSDIDNETINTIYNYAIFPDVVITNRAIAQRMAQCLIPVKDDYDGPLLLCGPEAMVFLMDESESHIVFAMLIGSGGVSLHYPSGFKSIEGKFLDARAYKSITEETPLILGEDEEMPLMKSLEFEKSILNLKPEF